ncbi:hypothetical protein ACLB2K_028729 [Fragaria x ananassa]
MRASSFYDCFCSLVCLTLCLEQRQLFAFASASINSASEAEALLKWRESLNQTQNNLTSSWTYNPSTSNAINSSGNPEANASACNGAWSGVSCNKAGSVSNISLSDFGLQGTLHEFLFSSFPNLEYLDLSFNKLFDIIPPQISSLTKLVYLHLSNNQFSGRIPLEIGLLRNLTFLNLHDNNLNDIIPKQIGHLKSLMELGLYNNQLTGSIPTSLGWV